MGDNGAMEAIRIENLTRTFRETTAVDRLTFSVAEGELFGLVGPDGAGKTTVMRLLTAILDPTAGDAWVAGYHSVRESEEIKRSIGYMSQRFGLYADLTVLENLNFYADIYGVPRRNRSDSIDRLLAFSHLEPFRRRLAGNLSGGMKQKLGLACTLIHTPKVLFLDEPTNGVDPVSRRDFWQILHQLVRDGVTIFVSTSYLDEAERCVRLALINRGRLLALGTPNEVKTLMRDTILELRTTDPRRAAAILRSGLPDCTVGLFGDRVHVASRDLSLTQVRAGVMLNGAGIGVSDTRTVAPTLADVFISVLAHEEGGVRHG
jgi:ABC-2 type transport system ATP-binding protein